MAALVKAQSSNAPKPLLTQAVQQLLAVAKGGTAAYSGDDVPLAGAEEPWPRVHALNVLCQLFKDGQLAGAMSAAQSPTLAVCITALGDPAWQVRLTPASALSCELGVEHAPIHPSTHAH